MVVLEHDPITATESEMPALRKIEGVLNSSECNGTSSNSNMLHLPKLVGLDGEEIELPPSVFQIMQQIIDHMMHGRTISIIPIDKELSTQDAADILNVSRPFLVSLLEAGTIPYIKVDTHRRIRITDLMEYKKRRDEETERGLAEITRMSEELGLYD